MSNHASPSAPRALPEHPNLRHLKDQAKDLLKSRGAKSLADAQFKVARLYGFPSWPKLKAHVDSLEQAGQLKQAIDANDLDRVKALMTRNPELHRAPMGYAKNGPLTWVAECRIPWGPPAPVRLAMAQWMIEHGSDVHQGGDGPLMRAALNGERIPMMELLVARGADVNAAWNGDFPIIFAPCETVDPAALEWLLRHGADPNCAKTTALDYLIGTYVRSPQFEACVDLLVKAGCASRYDLPGVLDTLLDRTGGLAAHLDADPGLINRRFPELDCGSTGARRLLLQGATLLHVAAEYGSLNAARLLLDRGAQVNAPAVGGQTPIFHSVTQFDDRGLPMTQLLLDRGADLSVRAQLPGHYERPDEVVDCTPLEYARLFPGSEFPGSNEATIQLLQRRPAMDKIIRGHFENIHSTNREVQGASYSFLLEAAAKPVDWAYEVWDELVLALRDEDNRKRSIAAQLLCHLALSDPEGRILRDLDKLLAVTKDEKFVTARHCLQALWRIGTAGKKQQKKLVDGLASRFAECIAEKNCTLIRYDILEGLRRLYDVVKDEKIRQKSVALIETESDLKYRRKYAALWR